MPHYKDGTLAKVGDIVKGKGYNVKDENGELAEITGVVINVNEGATVCNVTLLIPGNSIGTFTASNEYGALISGKIEYGQTDHFEKVK